MAFKALTNDEFVGKMEERRMTPDGKEIPDPRPVRPSIKVQRQPSMFDIHRQRMAEERYMRQMAENETEEDLSDFGPDSDDDLVERMSEYETADLEVTLRDLERSEASKSEPKPGMPSGGEPVDKPADNAKPGAGAPDALPPKG